MTLSGKPVGGETSLMLGNSIAIGAGAKIVESRNTAIDVGKRSSSIEICIV